VNIMMNHYVTERLGFQRMDEALRAAEDERQVRLAEAGQHDRADGLWSKVGGRMMPDAAGARKVPSL
jgi:hypothetical protein